VAAANSMKAGSWYRRQSSISSIGLRFSSGSSILRQIEAPLVRTRTGIANDGGGKKVRCERSPKNTLANGRAFGRAGFTDLDSRPIHPGTWAGLVAFQVWPRTYRMYRDLDNPNVGHDLRNLESGFPLERYLSVSVSCRHTLFANVILRRVTESLPKKFHRKGAGMLKYENGHNDRLYSIHAAHLFHIL
jgi:hypothetical protein